MQCLLFFKNIKGKPTVGVMPAAVWITVPKTLVDPQAPKRRASVPGHANCSGCMERGPRRALAD